jgi:tRNA(Ile)-lysidine synthase
MLPVQPFVDFITQNHLFEPGTEILAAVSGGMDSVLMARLLKAAGYQFAIAHCNFRLRGAESDADEQFCCKLADELQVPFYTTRFNTREHATEQHLSIQMAARELRYEWFTQLQQQHNYSVIALAHHQNDAIETILLNLTRGTGIAGLHGILPKNGALVRPLLFLTREQIQEVILQNSIAYREDSSNASTKYARNKIRQEVVPRLKELNPNLEDTMAIKLRHFRELESFFNQQLALLRQSLFRQQPDGIYIDIAQVKQLNPQHLLLHGLLKEYGFNETTIDDVIGSMYKHPGRVFYSTDHQLLLDRDALILTTRQTEHVPVVQLSEPDAEVQFGTYVLKTVAGVDQIKLQKRVHFADVDQDKLVYPLTLRTWQQGDFFIPLGMEGRKKISDFFINQKLPLHVKNQVPLLVNGNGEIIWVAGYRLDNRYKVTSQTKKVIIFELSKP